MKRSLRVVASATVTAALAVTVVAGALGTPGTASAASPGPLPADASAGGYVGLCNEAGQNVTGGSITTRPFVWRAVATTAPPVAYQGHGQNAVLGVFQPRTGTAPVEWGGTSLTAASYYKQRSHPAAQATYADTSLQSVIKRFPPEVDGLYVLRMYYGRAGYGDYSASYPTTTIQVIGTSWRVVQGGTVDCHSASAVSNEQLTGVAGTRSTTPRRPSATERTADTARARVISVPSADVEARAPHGASDGPGAATGSRTINASAASDTSRSTSTVVWVLLGLVLVLVVALGAAVRRRTRSSDS